MKKCFYAFCFALASLQAGAQWNSDPTVNNPVITSNESSAPKSNLIGTTDLFGSAFFAWVETRDTDADIFVQKVSSNGTIVFQVQAITVTNAIGNQLNPDIFPDGAGGAVLVWQDPRSGNADIYAQRVSNEGALLWQINGVPISNTASAETMPKIVGLNLSSFAVVWRDNRAFEGSTATGVDLYANKFSVVDGSKLWANDLALVVANGEQTSVTLNPDFSDGFIAVWADPRTSVSTMDVYAQRVDENGNKLWGSGTPNNGLLVSTSGAYTNTNPVSIFDGANGVGIAFQSTRPPGSSSDENIYFQRVNGVGTRLGFDVPLTNVAGSQTDPQITYVGAGFAVGWFDLRNAGTLGRDLYAQGVSPQGVPVLPTNGVPIAALEGQQPQTGFKIVPADNLSNSAIFVWDDGRNGTTDINIYAQRLTPFGVAWAANGVPVATRPGSNQTNLAVSPLSGPTLNNVIVGWLDNRSTAPTISYQDIYASMLQLDGTLPVVLLEFNAVGKNDRVETSWKTSSEINVKEYIVEKSADGRTFTPIGRVSAKGGNGANSYGFTDLKPLNGDNYYRLQAVDRDGSKEHSRIARVNMVRKLPAQVTVQPNPISSTGKLTFNNYENGNYQVRVIDARGAVVQSKSVNIQSTMQQMDVNLSNLARGRYWIQVLRNGTTRVSSTPVQKQ